jgi:hypothetical protein
MEAIVIEIIKGCLLGWFVVEFPLFAVIPSIIVDYFKIKNELIKFIIEKPFNCYKCAAFWATLIMTGNIFMAIAAGFIMKLYDQKLNSVEL